MKRKEGKEGKMGLCALVDDEKEKKQLWQSHPLLLSGPEGARE